MPHKAFSSLCQLSAVSATDQILSGLQALNAVTFTAEELPRDHTSDKVNKLLQPRLQQPVPFSDLASYLAAALPTKLPVPEAMYHRLTIQDSSLAHVIGPLSVSGAEALATLIGSALDSEEFQPTDEITIGGESLVS